MCYLTIFECFDISEKRTNMSPVLILHTYLWVWVGTGAYMQLVTQFWLCYRIESCIIECPLQSCDSCWIHSASKCQDIWNNITTNNLRNCFKVNKEIYSHCASHFGVGLNQVDEMIVEKMCKPHPLTRGHRCCISKNIYVIGVQGDNGL